MEADDSEPAFDSDEYFCSGQPCAHFPGWIRTPQEALDWLAYQALSIEPYVGHVKPKN